MNTLIFRTMAPLLGAILVLVSLLLLLDAHNAPGGGFAGGLVASAAAIVHGMARGNDRVRRLLRLEPLAIAGVGGLIAIVSGLTGLVTDKPFLTGLWLPANVFGTPNLFDVGIYLTVFGAVTAIALALEPGGEGSA